jgi:hypothetical protein
MRFVLAAGALLLIGFGSSPAGAWTDATRRRMVDDAIRITPPALATVLERYRADLMHGMTDPLRGEAGEEHREHPAGNYGSAADRIALHSKQAVTIIGQPHRLRLAVYALGTAAHYVADVDFPLNCSPGPVGDPIFYANYEKYAEKMMPHFPVVLDRKPSPELSKNHLEAFGKAAALRSSQFVAPIQSAYTLDGKPRSAAHFDEKSIPFGVASLSYSQSVNDIARLWTHLWRSAGGDLGGQPNLPGTPDENTASSKHTKGKKHDRSTP